LQSWGGLKKFIQFSTPEVYGSTTGWQVENNQFNPSTPYAISRAAGDQHLRAMHLVKKFPVIFIRTANIYGPFQPRYRLIPRLILNVLEREKLKLHGGGVSRRSFIVGEDVGRAVLAIMKCGEIGESYHISTELALPIIDVVKQVTDLMHVAIEDVLDVVDELPGKDDAYLLDSSKIRRDLGWSDRVSLGDGILQTIKWAEENLQQLLAQPAEYQHRS
jgi:dTDP-glucose 4,6-dehydratase